MSSLPEIQEAIGGEAAQRLWERFGGGEIRVPRRMADTHLLVRMLERPAADRLRRWAGGAFLYVPMPASAREDKVERLAREGMSPASIRLLAGVSLRAAQRRCRRLRDEQERQKTLPDSPSLR